MWIYQVMILYNFSDNIFIKIFIINKSINLFSDKLREEDIMNPEIIILKSSNFFPDRINDNKKYHLKNFY